MKVSKNRKICARVFTVPAHVAELVTTLIPAHVDGLSDGKQRVGTTPANAALLGTQSGYRVADQRRVNRHRYRAEHLMTAQTQQTVSDG